jgi:polysaccharide export outer membrane protein
MFQHDSHFTHFSPLGALAIILGVMSLLVQCAAAAQSPSPAPGAQSSYILGVDDQITIRVLEAEEVPDKPFRIDEHGDLDVPMIGSVHATGLSLHELSGLLAEKFSVYIRHPQVTLFLTEMRSQPVSILGAVTSPGIHQLQGHKSLIEMLALAGGVRADAGYRVKITRRAQWGTIPLPDAKTDSGAEVSVAEIGLKSLLDASHPSDNIAILPEDVITVPVAEMVYVMGEVKKPGGFVLGDRRELTVLQALAMADGATQSAKRSSALILRASSGTGSGAVTQIAVDLRKIIDGHAPDLAMHSTDILYVPGSDARRIAERALESMFSIGTGVAIYRP